jgi:hypothetical protein
MNSSRELKTQEEGDNALLLSCAVEEDEKLVTEAAVHIKRILAQTVQRSFEEVGQYLFATFYGSDAEAYFSMNQSKHASLRLLMDRCGTLELPVNKAFLARAIQMAVLLRQLPKQSRFLSLPTSHRLELLKVKSTDKVEQLAERAYEGNMTVQRLRDVVRKEVIRTKSTRGRKPIPTVLKALNACAKALRDEGTGRLALRRDDVAELNEEQFAEAQALADAISKRVDELLKLLG